jgi:hypothetical protein
MLFNTVALPNPKDSESHGILYRHRCREPRYVTTKRSGYRCELALLRCSSERCSTLNVDRRTPGLLNPQCLTADTTYIAKVQADETQPGSAVSRVRCWLNELRGAL